MAYISESATPFNLTDSDSKSSTSVIIDIARPNKILPDKIHSNDSSNVCDLEPNPETLVSATDSSNIISQTNSTRCSEPENQPPVYSTSQSVASDISPAFQSSSPLSTIVQLSSGILTQARFSNSPSPNSTSLLASIVTKNSPPNLNITRSTLVGPHLVQTSTASQEDSQSMQLSSSGNNPSQSTGVVATRVPSKPICTSDLIVSTQSEVPIHVAMLHQGSIVSQPPICTTAIVIQEQSSVIYSHGLAYPQKGKIVSLASPTTPTLRLLTNPATLIQSPRPNVASATPSLILQQSAQPLSSSATIRPINMTRSSQISQQSAISFVNPSATLLAFSIPTSLSSTTSVTTTTDTPSHLLRQLSSNSNPSAAGLLIRTNTTSSPVSVAPNTGSNTILTTSLVKPLSLPNHQVSTPVSIAPAKPLISIGGGAVSTSSSRPLKNSSLLLSSSCWNQPSRKRARKQQLPLPPTPLPILAALPVTTSSSSTITASNTTTITTSIMTSSTSSSTQQTTIQLTNAMLINGLPSLNRAPGVTPTSSVGNVMQHTIGNIVASGSSMKVLPTTVLVEEKSQQPAASLPKPSAGSTIGNSLPNSSPPPPPSTGIVGIRVVPMRTTSFTPRPPIKGESSQPRSGSGDLAISSSNSLAHSSSTVYVLTPSSSSSQVTQGSATLIPPTSTSGNATSVTNSTGPRVKNSQSTLHSQLLTSPPIGYGGRESSNHQSTSDPRVGVVPHNSSKFSPILADAMASTNTSSSCRPSMRSRPHCNTSSSITTAQSLLHTHLLAASPSPSCRRSSADLSSSGRLASSTISGSLLLTTTPSSSVPIKSQQPVVKYPTASCQPIRREIGLDGDSRLPCSLTNCPPLGRLLEPSALHNSKLMHYIRTGNLRANTRRHSNSTVASLRSSRGKCSPPSESDQQQVVNFDKLGLDCLLSDVTGSSNSELGRRLPESNAYRQSRLSQMAHRAASGIGKLLLCENETTTFTNLLSRRLLEPIASQRQASRQSRLCDRLDIDEAQMAALFPTASIDRSEPCQGRGPADVDQSTPPCFLYASCSINEELTPLVDSLKELNLASSELENELAGLRSTLAQLNQQLELLSNESPQRVELIQLRTDLTELIAIKQDQLTSALASGQLKSPTASNDLDSTNQIQSELECKLIGQRCAIPWWTNNGRFTRHNAVICGLIDIDKTTNSNNNGDVSTTLATDNVPQPPLRVRVFLTHPTRLADLPCRNWLNHGACNRGIRCAYSHGIVIDCDDLSEWRPPPPLPSTSSETNHRCLAKPLEGLGLWHPARLIGGGSTNTDQDSSICIKWGWRDKPTKLSYASELESSVASLPADSVWMLLSSDDEAEDYEGDEAKDCPTLVNSNYDYEEEEEMDSSASDQDTLSEPCSSSTTQQTQSFPKRRKLIFTSGDVLEPAKLLDIQSFKPAPITVKNSSQTSIGGWELHTRGIGSRLLKAMGYSGSGGLGRNAEGYPLPVCLLLQDYQIRSSRHRPTLDRLIQSRSNDVPPRRRGRRSRKSNQSSTLSSGQDVTGIKRDRSSHSSLFNFLNTTLSSSSGTSKINNHNRIIDRQNLPSSSKTTETASSESTSRMELFQLAEKLAKLKSKQNLARQSIERNKGRDRAMCEQAERNLAQLTQQIKLIQAEQKTRMRKAAQRRDTDKLRIF